MSDGFVLVSLLVPECDKEYKHKWARINESLDSVLCCRHCNRCINTYIKRNRTKPAEEVEK